MAGIRDLTALFQDAVQKSNMGVKAIASELDKAPSTLYEELLPVVNRTGQAKLGVEDAVTLLELTQDFRPLEHIASRLGFVLVKLDSICPDKPTLVDELLDDLPALAAFHLAMREGNSLTDVHGKLMEVEKDLREDFVAYREELAKRPGRMKGAA